MKRYVTILLFICAPALAAQSSSSKPAAHSANGADSLTPSSLNVDGLNYGRELDRIYWGDFEHVHMSRNGLEFGLMLGTYMKNYGASCSSSLPRNKVQIMEQVCTEESYWVNGYGVERAGSRSCSHYETRGTGIYADPELYDASQTEDGKMTMALLGTVFDGMSKTGDAGINAAMGNLMQSMDVARQAGEFKADIQQMLRTNACGGAPLKRLEKNLIAYATNKPSIRMANLPVKTGPFRDSDYQTLLDDLVGEQSGGWMLNRFVGGSIANVAVDRRDDQGQPESISANYAYTGMRGRAEGSVRLNFEDNAPSCLTFADVPDACRAVSRRLAAAYEDGKYVTDHPAGLRTYVAPDLRQVEVIADGSKGVLVELAGNLTQIRQGVRLPARGKLLQDIRGTGPGGESIVLQPAGTQAMLSIFNSQKGTEIRLTQVGTDPSQAIQFSDATKLFRPLPGGGDGLPRDGSPVQLSFALPPNTKTKMLLTDYEKRKTAAVADTALAPGSGGISSNHVRVVEPRKVMPAGTDLALHFADQITVDQVGPGKVFPTIVVREPGGWTERPNALPEGTTVYVEINQGQGNQYVIRADHAVLDGMTIPLETDAAIRIPYRAPRSAPVQTRVWGGIRLPATPSEAAGSAVLIRAPAVIHLVTKSNVALDGAPDGAQTSHLSK